MEVTILGAGTLLPNDRCRSAGHLLETGGATVLLDCGSGVLHALDREGKDWRGVTHVAISHFHTDHFGDLAALLWAWKHGSGDEPPPTRTLLGPPGLVRVMDALAEAFGDHVREPGGPLEVIEMGRSDRWDDPGAGIGFRTHPTPHTDESMCIRVEGEGWSVGYTGDTGPSDDVGSFLRGVDVLIAECALPDDQATGGHLTPRSAGDLAAAADPGVLVLTHFYPGVPTDSLPDLIHARGYTGTVHAGYDGLRLPLPGS